MKGPKIPRLAVFLATCAVCAVLLLWNGVSVRPGTGVPPPQKDGITSADGDGKAASVTHSHVERMSALTGGFGVSLKDRLSGAVVSSFRVLLAEVDSDGAISDLIDLPGLSFSDGIGSAHLPNDWLGRQAWVAAAGYAPICIEDLQRISYDLVADFATNQIVQMTYVDGAPIVDAIVAISRSSFDGKTCRWSVVAEEARKDTLEVLGSIRGGAFGMPVLVSKTNARGEAAFVGAQPGVYWIDYNRGQAPFVRCAIENPIQVSVPSAPCVATFIPLGSVVVTECQAMAVSRKLDRSRFPLFDYEDARIVRSWHDSLSRKWVGACVWVGPCSALSRCAAPFIVDHPVAGFLKADLEVIAVKDAFPVRVDPMLAVYKEARTCKFRVVGASGDHIQVMDGASAELFVGDYALPVTLGREVRVPMGDYMFSLRGVPPDALAIQRVSISTSDPIDIPLEKGWRCYSIDVSRAGVPVSSFGVSYQMGKMRSSRGISGASCQIWSNLDQIEVSLSHRGSTRRVEVLKWAGADSLFERFHVAVE